MAKWRETFGRAARVAEAEDLPQALQQLARADYDAVGVDWRFHCGTWREAVQMVGAMYPDLPVIVISRSEGIEQGIQEWIEVVKAGAFDLLVASDRESAALSLLEHAVATSEARALRATALPPDLAGGLTSRPAAPESGGGDKPISPGTRRTDGNSSSIAKTFTVELPIRGLPFSGRPLLYFWEDVWNRSPSG
ncbi:MAG: response regulator [Acidobacteria bacterium]|nr:response regulator [Acidobacteriota bacterium]